MDYDYQAEHDRLPQQAVGQKLLGFPNAGFAWPMVTWTRGLNLCGVKFSVVSNCHWLWKVWYVFIHETLTEGQLCSYSPCASWPCDSLIALCHCSYHPVMLCKCSITLTVLDHSGIGTLLVPCRWGSQGTGRGIWAHSRNLGNTWSKVLFPVCLTTEWWSTPESLFSRSCWICASSVCLDEVLLQKVTTDGY